MSLYLPDQKLGSHSQPGGSSHKFILKGRQTGSMHRGHSWVFRAESYDTMLAWYEDIKSLTEKSGEERNAFVRRHTRSVSQGSHRSVSSDGGLDEDEADEVPYSANQSMTNEAVREEPPQRPSPGGRFPSDIQVNHLQAPLSPSSGSSEIDHDLTTASGGLQGPYLGFGYQEHESNYELGHPQQHSAPQSIPQPQQEYPQQYVYNDGAMSAALNSHPQQSQAPYPTSSNPAPSAYQPEAPYVSPIRPSSYPNNPPGIERHNSMYGDWMAPAAGGAAAGVLGTEAYRHHQQQQEPQSRYPIEETPAPVSHSHVPEPAPLNHTSPSEPVSLTNTVSTIPTPVSNDPARNEPFLGEAEAVPAAASAVASKTSGPALQETEEIFPSVIRHNTDVSISDLHVPGQYPQTPAA